MRLRVVNLGGKALEEVTWGITTDTDQPFVLLKLEAEPLIVSVLGFHRHLVASRDLAGQLDRGHSEAVA